MYCQNKDILLLQPALNRDL